MRMVKRIEYDPEWDRLTFNGWDIHCGDVFEVLMPNQEGTGTWQSVRFEYSDRWYMPDYPCTDPVGLWARETVERSEEREKGEIRFFNQRHHDKYDRFLNQMRAADPHHQATAYLLAFLALKDDVESHLSEIFDFAEDVILPDGLSAEWLMDDTVDRKTVRLLFNLWNGYHGQDSEQSRYYTVSEIFACPFAPYYWQAIRLNRPVFGFAY